MSLRKELIIQRKLSRYTIIFSQLEQEKNMRTRSGEFLYRLRAEDVNPLNTSNRILWLFQYRQTKT